MDTSHLLSRQRRPQSYRIPIQRIDGRCDRVRASTHRWLDEAPTSKGACLRLTFPTPVHQRFLPQRSGWPDCSILRRRRYRLCTSITTAGTKIWILHLRLLLSSHKCPGLLKVADEQSAENCAPATICCWGQRPTGRSSSVTRWRRTGWLGRQDSNLRIAESKSSDKAKGRKDRNVRVKERPCNPSRQTTAAPGSSRRAPQHWRKGNGEENRRGSNDDFTFGQSPARTSQAGDALGSCASSPPTQARFPPASRWCRDRRRSSIRRCWLCAEHHRPPSCWASG